jgi:hypothetical protein
VNSAQQELFQDVESACLFQRLSPHLFPHLFPTPPPSQIISAHQQELFQGFLSALSAQALSEIER